jgi:hypothetical protein
VKATINSVKPCVFIGSSSEGLSVAYALQNNLEDAAEITVWTQDVFRPTEYILESLLKQLSIADIGAFVFSADDLVRMRGVEYAGARDNVIFEFGLFVGHLGRDKSIIVAPKDDNPRLPSDLLGVNVLKFQSDRADGNLDAALGPASNKIRALLADVQPKATSIPRELRIPILERRDLLTNQQRGILTEIEARNQCTKDELASVLPRIPVTELTYRLEQLKLLMFISESKSSNLDATTMVYALSESYKRACSNRIALRSDL